MNIFISYRRHDTAGEAGRLVDSLKQYFKEEEIFIDIETIQPGLDFKEVIENSIRSCDVLLALIGPSWLTITSASGKRRIDDPDDFIRLEIAEALKRNIRVIPVLVDGATLPESAELPDDLKGLVRRQAYEVSNKRWKFDVEELVFSLKPGPRPKPIPIPDPPFDPQPKPKPEPLVGQQQPKNWLVESILVTIVCCIPFGIAGIVNASKVDNLYRAGDYAGADKASKDAAKWTKYALIAGIIVYAIYIIYAVSIYHPESTSTGY